MTTTAPLTLRQLVAAKLGDGITDYRAAARDIVALIPPSERDEYLVQAVMPLIAEVNGQRRRAAFDALGGSEADETTAPETTTADTGHSATDTQGARAGVGGGSFPATAWPTTEQQQRAAQPVKPGTAAQNFARQDRFRDFWSNLLDSVGMAADGGRKRVGDMTAEDLRANVDYRAELARENLARANQFRDLLAMVEAQGVATVGELTPPSRAA